jgi:Domain of unknown function (DUF5597)/Beta-galactosidase
MPTLPLIARHSTGFSFEIDGKETILLGGQIHNSSSSCKESIDSSFAKVASLNYDFVISPISWKQFEPSEGKFDHSLLEYQIRSAQKHGLRLVLIWFGAFKNAKSMYAPDWVRADVQRFPRALNKPGGEPSDAPTLSVFSKNLLDADLAAFSELMKYLKAKDKNHTVLIVQIENEMGLLGSSRDYSEAAVAAWNQRGIADTWQENEKFMAEAFAKYANALATSGKKIKNLPMYVNAWLGPQHGQTEAGQWPSGGPSSLVLDTWKKFAPEVDILSPDIYELDALPVMAQYSRSDNPLFIPESRHIVGNLFWALGHHKAIGYAMFAAEDGRVGNQMSSAYAILREAKHTIASAQKSGTIRALLMQEPTAEPIVKFGSLTVEPKDTLAGLKRFVEVAGVDLLIKDVKLPSELEDLPVTIESPADTRPSGIVMQLNESEYYLIGKGINLSFSEPGYRIEIDDVEEGRFENDKWIPMRNLNGDERLNFVPLHEIGCAKIRIQKFKLN